MPSPFPGMDPFIEQQEWRDFHHGMISVIQELLTPHVLPRYVVRVEEDVYLIPAPDADGELRRPRRVVLDNFIVASDVGSPLRSGGGAVALAAIEPVTLTLPLLVEQRQSYLTVRYRESREVVTMIECLSPTNKGSDGRESYLRKREAVLRSPAHLVELDLLRGGERLPTVEALPPADYYAFVTRVPRRPEVTVYPWSLAHPLPPIPIPLGGEDADVWLDLQTAFTIVYERAAYAYSLEYGETIEPPLREAGAAWVQEVLAAVSQP